MLKSDNAFSEDKSPKNLEVADLGTLKYPYNSAFFTDNNLKTHFQTNEKEIANLKKEIEENKKILFLDGIFGDICRSTKD